MILLFQGKVEVLQEHNAFVRTVRFTFRIPSVLKLNQFVKPRQQTCIRFSRENVYTRDNYHCQYCNRKFASRHLTLDHVIPAVQGGKKVWTNIVTACISCNQVKGGRTPSQAGMRLVKKPVIPNWLPKVDISFSTSEAPESWKEYLSVFL